VVVCAFKKRLGMAKAKRRIRRLIIGVKNSKARS